MNRQEWIIQCNYLKNLMDSYGISVVLSVKFPCFPKTRIGQILRNIQRKFPQDFLGTGNKNQSNYHITLFPLMRSLFVFPKDSKRRKICFEMMNQLQESMSVTINEKDRYTFRRISEARSLLSTEAKSILTQKWNDSFACESKIKQSLNSSIFKIIKYELKLTKNGSLIIAVSELMEKMALHHIVTYLNIDSKSYLQRNHITLGYVKSLNAYKYLWEIVKEYSQEEHLDINIGKPEIIAYQHRSLNAILREEKIM